MHSDGTDEDSVLAALSNSRNLPERMERGIRIPFNEVSYLLYLFLFGVTSYRWRCFTKSSLQAKSRWMRASWRSSKGKTRLGCSRETPCFGSAPTKRAWDDISRARPEDRYAYSPDLSPHQTRKPLLFR